MKQEDRDLLLRYLSMALPYNTIVSMAKGEIDIIERKIKWNKEELTLSLLHQIKEEGAWEFVKPYLRPLSSMTDEEDKQRMQLGIWRSSQINGHEVTGIKPDISQSYNSQAFQRAFNFLLKNHFDIFGLIPRDLAVEVTKENNPYNIIEK